MAKITLVLFSLALLKTLKKFLLGHFIREYDIYSQCQFLTIPFDIPFLPTKLSSLLTNRDASSSTRSSLYLSTFLPIFPWPKLPWLNFHRYHNNNNLVALDHLVSGGVPWTIVSVFQLFFVGFFIQVFSCSSLSTFHRFQIPIVVLSDPPPFFRVWQIRLNTIYFLRHQPHQIA